MDQPLAPSAVEPSRAVEPAAAAAPTPGEKSPAAPRRKLHWYHLRWWFTNFLVVSVLAHVVFGLLATYFIVQVVTAKRKQDFAPGPAGPSAPTRELEHKVNMAKKQQTMSAPAAAKRITTTSASRVSLPALPAMPMTESVVPVSMAGMGGTGVSLGAFGNGGGGSGGGAGGKVLNIFGSSVGGQGLVGTFYDLKQSRNKTANKMDVALYAKVVTDFVMGGFNTGVLSNYFRSPRPLYATQIFTPDIDADEGPAAFNVQNEVQPRMWCVHYKGKVRAPASGTFHFVGMGDDLLIVRFNGKLVLDAGWLDPTKLPGQTFYKYKYGGPPRGFARGPAVAVESGQTYPMEVLIGEQPGGRSCAALMMEQEGTTYEKEEHGSPVLPIFRMSGSTKLLPASPDSRGYAPHAEGGPVWTATPDTTGLGLSASG